MLNGMALCGSLCYVFWEAQSMYILPFVVALLPVVGSALVRVPVWVDVHIDELIDAFVDGSAFLGEEASLMEDTDSN